MIFIEFHFFKKMYLERKWTITSLEIWKKNISEGEGGIRTNYKVIGIKIVWHQLKMRANCGNSIQGALILSSCFLSSTSPLPPNLFLSGQQGVQLLTLPHFLAHHIHRWFGPALPVFFPPVIPDPRFCFPSSKCTHSDPILRPTLFKFLNSTFCFKDNLTVSHIVFQSIFHHSFTCPPSSNWFPTTMSNAAANVLIHLPLQIYVSMYLDCVSRAGPGQRACIYWIFVLLSCWSSEWLFCLHVRQHCVSFVICHLSTSSPVFGIITGLSKMCHLWEA